MIKQTEIFSKWLLKLKDTKAKKIAKELKDD